jgi:hypothetical protein
MMSDLHRLRRYSYKGEGDEIAELIGDIHWAADEIERLTDDVAALGQECIDLRLTTRDKPPWMMPPLDEWSIVGMNHYHVGGERRLFVSMARDGRCIKAEGVDDEYLWNRLWHQATESSDEDMVANATIERNGDLEREIESLTAQLEATEANEQVLADANKPLLRRIAELEAELQRVTIRFAEYVEEKS